MWVYNNEELTDEIAKQYYGFVYLIRNKTNGKQYIGRKYFTKAATRQVNKKKKKIRKDSGWKEYWSSSQKLLAEIEERGKQVFYREVLRLCKTRGESI